MNPTDLPQLPAATSRDFVLWTLRRRRRLRVTGPSMEPSLVDGDVIFVDQAAYRSHGPHDLDIVVSRHPAQPHLEIVKRVEFTTADGAFLISDNRGAHDASDSRRFGVVPLHLILGKVTAVAATNRSAKLPT